MSRFCPNCGNEVADDARFCAGCGKPVSDGEPVQQRAEGGASRPSSVGFTPEPRATQQPSGPASPDLPPAPQPGPPPIDVPQPPQQPGGSRRWLKLAGGGCALVAGLGLLLVFVLVLAATCGGGGDSGGAGNGGASPSGDVVPNRATGTVTNANGEPIEGAEINLYGLSTVAGEDILDTTRSAADGTYSLEVPDGELQLYADYTFPYGGQQWTDYSLFPVGGPDSTTVFDGAEGVVQDYELRISGLEPGGDPNDDFAYYGGYIHVNYSEENSGTTPQDAAFTFVLTPTGPLADGSEGETITVERSYAQLSGGDDDDTLDTSSVLYDIPVGTYTMSGELALPDGTTFPLEIELFGNRSEQLEIVFEPLAGSADMIQVTTYAPGASEGQEDTQVMPWEQQY